MTASPVTELFACAGVRVMLRRYPPSPTVWVWVLPPAGRGVLIDFYDAAAARLWAWHGCRLTRPGSPVLPTGGALHDWRAEFLLAVARVEQGDE